MRLLLDTHILVWALAADSRLSRRARELLEDPDNDCSVSSASVWEIVIKAMLGKMPAIPVLERLDELIEEAGFEVLNVGVRHALGVARVHTAHADPFDRLLIAQAEAESMRLLTADRNLIGHPAVLDAG